MLSLPSLARRQSDALILGKIGKSRFSASYRLPAFARTAHLFTCGKTGKGKSSFLLNCIYQDIVAGRSCSVLDPHSDLTSDILALLLARGALEDNSITKRIIYLNPVSGDTVPLNPLAAKGDDYVVVQGIIEAMKRAWETLSAAPNFENNALYSLLLLRKTGQKLHCLPRLWSDEEYRLLLIQKAGDAEIASFFNERVANWGQREAALRAESLLNKSTAITMNPYLRPMLDAETCFDFRTLMDGGNILLADLGHCDEESQRLIGNLITTGIEQAAFSRHDIEKAKRRPHYLYIDEFQDFTANSGSVKTLSKILSGARKYGLHISMACQHLGQLSERMKSAVLGNVWTKVVFGVSEADSYEFARYVGLGQVDPMDVKHEAQSEGQHPVFSPVGDQFLYWAEKLASQRPGQAIVRDHEGKTTQIWTLPIEHVPPFTKPIRQILSAPYP